jgi:hypothetical protein
VSRTPPESTVRASNGKAWEDRPCRNERWITSYYWAIRHSRDRIGQLRDSVRDPLIFYRLEWLNERMLVIDRRELGADHVNPADEEAFHRQFLSRESHLEAE